MTQKIYYDVEKFDFKSKIHEILEISDVTKIHLLSSGDRDLTHFALQNTIWHRRFYSKFNEISNLYRSFLESVILPFFGFNKVVYQKVPTFRVHYVKSKSVTEFHKDKEYNHQESEVNLWLPFSDVYDTNTIWIESEEDKGDFSSCNVNYGEVLVFDGANLCHGTKFNETNDTRVSIDFRICDFDKFSENSRSTIVQGKKLTIDDYFDVI